MKKVKNIYLGAPEEMGADFATGLVIELEDGTMFRHQSTDPIQPFGLMQKKIEQDRKPIKAHDFPAVYQALGIDLSKLGCIMLDLEPFSNAYTPEVDGAGITLYYAKNKERFWIDGWVFDKPHITLLYGLMTPGNESPMKELVPQVLEGWDMEEVEIADFGYFDSPYEDEPYYCIVAHVRITKALQEGHDRLSFLPHIKTFPGYKAHVTVEYLAKNQGEQYRDTLIEQYRKMWVGKTMKVKGLNLGGNKRV